MSSIFEHLENRRLLSSVLFVDANAPGPTHDGSSWGKAYADLQQALAAATAGDQIRVADGVYVPGTAMSDTFALGNGVNVVGGYAGYGAASPDARDPARTPSILRGSQYPYTIVTATALDSTSVMDGFTIGPDQPFTQLFFGELGLSCTNGSPVFENCTFANLVGGAVVRNASPTFLNCTFSNNQAAYGGAINSALSSITAIGCTFTGNRCTSVSGGAIYSTNSSLELSDCSFVRNINHRHTGGAIYFDGSADITNCGFYANFALDPGGAIDAAGQLSVVNCAFIGNDSAEGGAINVELFSGSASIRRSTFTQNISHFIGGAVAGNASSITGSIFWNDSEYEGGEIDVSGSNIIGNDIQGWKGLVGSGNISADPLFVRAPSPGADRTWGTADDDYGDLRLQFYSPCIDVGFDHGYDDLNDAKDLAGNPRVVDFPGIPGNDPPIDMGAYETPAAFIALAGRFDVDAPQPSVQFTFNMDVYSNAVFSSTLMLTNLTTGQTINTSFFAAVSYDAATRTAIWSLPASALPDGDYRATLRGGSIKNSSDQPLASDFSIDFFVLAGDANRDRRVDVTDLGIFATNWQISGRKFSQGDFNYDGNVDVKDLSILATNWQQGLPTLPLSALAASIASQRLTSSRAIDLVQL